MQALLFPLRPNHFMKLDGFPNSLFNKKRPGAQGFKFADIILQRIIYGKHRVDIFNFLLPYIQNPAADRGIQPLMQTAGIIIRIQIGYFKVKMSKAMRPVHHYFNPPLMGFLCYFFHG